MRIVVASAENRRSLESYYCTLPPNDGISSGNVAATGKQAARTATRAADIATGEISATNVAAMGIQAASSASQAADVSAEGIGAASVAAKGISAYSVAGGSKKKQIFPKGAPTPDTD